MTTPIDASARETRLDDTLAPPEWVPGPDPLDSPHTAWVASGPVRARIFELSAQTGLPWWTLLDLAGWPPRLARRMGLGPIPRRVPLALATSLEHLLDNDVDRAA